MLKRRTFLGTVLSFALLCSASARAGDERLHVIVLHTNDVHGQAMPRKATWMKNVEPKPTVGGLPRLAAKVNEIRALAKKDGAEVVVVDAGDWYQGTPEGIVEGGVPFVKALSAVGYDAMCIGNHEFDFGVPNLQTILRDAKVPSVCANLRVHETKKAPDWVAPWKIIERGGMKIAIVGLVTVATPEMTHPDAKTLDFVDPIEQMTLVTKELAGKADWILPVTHIGVRDDHALAKAFPSLPLIVGGHSHTRLPQGEVEGTTSIVQTGTKAEVLGRVDLWFDRATKACVETKCQLVELREEPAAEFVNAAVTAACAELAKKSDERMAAVVGELAGPLTRAKSPLESSSAGNLVADALREHTRADVGLMNRGGLRSDIEGGKITRRTIFEFVPFENNITTLKMKGSELREFMRRAVESVSHSGVEISGVVLEISVGADDKRTLTGLRVGGKPIENEREYRVAMNSFMADGGDAFLDKAASGPNRVDDPMLMRELLEELFKNHPRIVPVTENRFEVKKP